MWTCTFQPPELNQPLDYLFSHFYSQHTDQDLKICQHSISSVQKKSIIRESINRILEKANVTCQDHSMIKVKNVIISNGIEFSLPHAKAIQKDVNIAGSSQFFWIIV